MSCVYADRDGSYVLGALSPAERRDFEQHLAGCAECARSVRELAGLPGLLARVDPAVLEQPSADEPVPATVLPALLRAVRRSRRRHSLLTAGSAAAAAAAVAAVAVPMVVSGSSDGGRSPAAAPSAGPSSATAVTRAMAPVGHAPVRASIRFAPVAWGTKLELTCTYDPKHDSTPVHLPKKVTYGLFVGTRDGTTEQVGTWSSVAERTTRVTAATAATPKDISWLEVRTADGHPVLSLAG